MKARRLTTRSGIGFLIAFFLLFSFLPPAVAGDYGSIPLQWGSRGEYVKTLQQDLTGLGFSTYGADGIFGRNTYAAVVDFQKSQGLNADGIVGAQTKTNLNRILANQVHIVQPGDTLYKLAGRYGTSVQAIMKANGLSSASIFPGNRLTIPTGNNYEQPSRGSGQVERADWWTVASQVFARGDVATVTDVDTGISYRVIRSGGSNHADCQPLTAQDTAKMKAARGGNWNWNRRAIIVTIDGHRFAASQNGMPHGNQTIYDNNFPGHFCIHFLNSRTHGTNRVDAAHQSMVQRAFLARI